MVDEYREKIISDAIGRLMHSKACELPLILRRELNIIYRLALRRGKLEASNGA